MRGGKPKGIMELPMRHFMTAALPTGAFRPRFFAFASLAMLALAGCQTSSTNLLAPIDKAQGSSENISSLTAVIERNPRDPEGYNVRGSAYGRAGRYKEALRDFDTALQLNPNFYQAYANRALIYRFMGEDVKAANDYNRAIQINPQYDVAYIGRGNVYRQAGRLDEAFNDFNRAIQLDTTNGRAYHNRGLIYQARGQHKLAIEDFLGKYEAAGAGLSHSQRRSATS